MIKKNSTKARLSLGMVLVFMFSLVLPVGVQGKNKVTSDEIVEIPDNNLREAISGILGLKPEEDITREDMENIGRFHYEYGEYGSFDYHLHLANKGIEDITGLEHAINIERINLSSNNIQDLSPLADAEYLSLQSLNLSNNKIVDITPLVKANMPELSNAYFGSGDGIAYSKGLDLSGNQIIDISPIENANWLKLHSINLSNNQINNLSPLKNFNLPELSGFTHNYEKIAYGLDLSNNQIKDLSILSEVNLPALINLNLSGNKIEDLNPLVDSDFFRRESEDQHDFGFLNLSNNAISDLSPLEEADWPLITGMNLSSNHISNFTSFGEARLPNLGKVFLHYVSCVKTFRS